MENGAIKWQCTDQGRHMVAMVTMAPFVPLAPIVSVAFQGDRGDPFVTNRDNFAPLVTMVPMDYQYKC